MQKQVLEALDPLEDETGVRPVGVDPRHHRGGSPSFEGVDDLDEYPDPQHDDPITTDEVDDAIEVARACLAAAEKLIAAPQLGVF